MVSFFAVVVSFRHMKEYMCAVTIALMRDDVTRFLSYAKVRLGGGLSFVFCLLIEE